MDVISMGPEDMLGWMLAKAKENPMKIHHDFETRFRVWVEQIIPNRINAIRQCGGNGDYALRMVRLTNADADRLVARRRLECDRDDDARTINSVSDVDEVFVALAIANDMYLNEAKE